MLPVYITEEKIRIFIKEALIEDVGSGDHTSLACVPADAKGKAQLIFKEEGIAAGLALSQYIFKYVDKNLQIDFFKKDGDLVHYGDIGLIVEGSVHAILKAERLVLNCMQRMSAIATLTKKYAEEIKFTKTKLLDTRKTTPHFRMMEKWAVTLGGGNNHRFGLYDMILIKDNHIDYAGGIANAIGNTLQYLEKNNLDLKIEIETRNLEEVKQVLDKGHIQRILLDNMLVSTLKEAVSMIDGRYETEASGGINLNKIKEIAETGVDFISVGKLTHSYKSLDISLKAIK